MKPLLAVEYNSALLRLPVWASPKLDGIRGLMEDNVKSRSLKPIPNKHIQNVLSVPDAYGLDGELIVGSPTAEDCYTQSVSHVMSHDKIMDFSYYVFDLHDSLAGYEARHDLMLRQVESALRLYPRLPIIVHERRLIKTAAELDEYESDCLERGYEGLILRKIDGLYKFGRSTVKEGYLLKVKRFVDSEARIVGFEEQMENTNEKQTNELGRSKRSSHQAGKVGKGTLGALLLQDLITGVKFSCGTGMDDKLRQGIWDRREEHMGLIWKYKSFPIGVKDLPRHPVSIGPRSLLDMS